MAVLAVFVIVTLPLLSFAQFPVTDGVNDLFAIFTQCPINPVNPPENQYFCYRTNMRMLSGFTLCDPIFVRQRNLSIGVVSQNYTIYFLNTPGRLRGANYVNRLLCKWNIRCPAGQLMYYDIPEHTLENPVVSPFFSQPTCLDFLRLSRDFGDEVSCGTSFPPNDLEPSRVIVQFRSNRRIRRPGFRMRIVCFDPVTQDSEGCTTSNRKRDIKQDEEETVDGEEIDKILASAARRQKRVLPSSSRLEQENIPRDAIVTYGYNTVAVVRNKTVLFSYTGITSFHSYNEFDGVNSFYKISKTKIFRGFGVITIVDVTAYYVIFGVETRFLPNSAQQAMITKLLDAEEQLVQDEDDIIPENSPSQGPTRPNDRKRRQSSSTFPPSITSVAQANSKSCNAVLKAVANSILTNSGNRS